MMSSQARVSPHERVLITIPAADGEQFESWMQSPAKDVPVLRELAKMRPAWQGADTVSAAVNDDREALGTSGF